MLYFYDHKLQQKYYSKTIYDSAEMSRIWSLKKAVREFTWSYLVKKISRKNRQKNWFFFDKVAPFYGNNMSGWVTPVRFSLGLPCLKNMNAYLFFLLIQIYFHFWHDERHRPEKYFSEFQTWREPTPCLFRPGLNVRRPLLLANLLLTIFTGLLLLSCFD